MKNAVNDLKGKRVFVGLSGGVDSAVTAALLLQQGADVVGVFIQGWYPPGMPCTWAEDRRDAMRVAAHLHIPFITLDASREYKEGVIDYLLREYKAGRTPNPDIMCNREVKFGAFYRYAKENGADFIATGHYARVLHGEEVELHRGIDPAKDQSYFLWAVPKEAIAFSLFPLGNSLKQSVRTQAQKLRLPVAEKRDSQGICFLGSISVDDFLKAEFKAEPGKMLLKDGTHIGTHAGAVLFTLGQRVSSTDAPAGPWFVIAKDIQANTLTVAHAVELQERAELALSEQNWLMEPGAGEIEAQYRYHGPRVRGILIQNGTAFLPSEPLPEAPAEGQSLVFYSGTRVLGGAIISK